MPYQCESSAVSAHCSTSQLVICRILFLMQQWKSTTVKVPRTKASEHSGGSLRMSYKAAASSIWCDYVCPRLITGMLLIFRNTPEHSDAASNHNSWTSTKMIYLNISIKLKKELYECKKLCCFITVYRKFKVSSWSNRLLRLGSFWVSQFWLFYCEFK